MIMRPTLREEAVMAAMLNADPRWKDAMARPRFAEAVTLMTRSLVLVLDAELKYTSPSIDDLELSVRPYNVLKREGIETVDQLCELSWADLADMRNMGLKSIDEIEAKLLAARRKLKIPTPYDHHPMAKKENQ